MTFFFTLQTWTGREPKKKRKNATSLAAISITFLDFLA